MASVYCQKRKNIELLTILVTKTKIESNEILMKLKLKNISTTESKATVNSELNLNRKLMLVAFVGGVNLPVRAALCHFS